MTGAPPAALRPRKQIILVLSEQPQRGTMDTGWRLANNGDPEEQNKRFHVSFLFI